MFYQIYNNIYHNFFTVCSLIPTAFTFLLGILFTFIKEKSIETKILISTYYMMGVFYLGWFIAAIVYHPIGAFHRWLTIIGCLSCGVLYLAFFMFFPKNIFGKKNKVLISLISIYFTIITILFFIHSLKHGDTFYNFESHNYDFLLSSYDMLIIFSLIGSLFLILSYSIYQTLTTKNSSRWSALGIGITIFITIMIPSITHALSKNGLFDRGLYQVSQDFSSLTGFFIIAIIYINATKDKTTLITKIIAISFAAFLMVFQGVSFFALKKQEVSYSELKNKDTQISVISNNKIYNKDLHFFYQYNMNDFNFTTRFNPANNNNVNTQILRQYMINSYIYESFLNNNALDLTKTNYYFQLPSFQKLYFKTILNGNFNIPTTLKNNNKMNNFLNKNIFFKQYNTPSKMIETYNTEFENSNHIYSGIFHSKSFSPETAKLFLIPYIESYNYFFYIDSSKNHYIVFLQTDLKNSIVSAAGYHYTDYRAFLHPTAEVFLISLIIIILVVLFCFRFFFHGTIIKPLKEFQKTIKAVQQGNRDTRVNILVEDEIGYVAHAFNNMLCQITEAEKKLQKHADTLELRVEERSNKLIQAEKMASLGRMVAGIAHEINTPVGIGITAASHLNKQLDSFIPKFENGTATKTEFANLLISFDESSKIISSNLDKAANLISTFKMVAADQHIDESREIKIFNYIQRTILSLNTIIRPANVTVDVNCEENISFVINPGLLYQILNNLISNSLTHAFQDHNGGKITISVEKENENNLSLIYTDDGIGIPEDTISKIFDPFFTTAREKGGTGLGLNIIYNIVVSQLNGSINVISEKNKGTTFFIKMSSS